MRYLVLTDIHANLEALDACLADALAHTYDATLVLGDLVGYGPDPNGVVDRVQALKPLAIVRGNHDKVACGTVRRGFNSVARAPRSGRSTSSSRRTATGCCPKGRPKWTDRGICHGSR
jgi:predicted phosphodiesterase